MDQILKNLVLEDFNGWTHWKVATYT
jgi:hypothetical protein